ncbi:MAG: serine hydrolase [Candidatus Latescibacteria bacterium]|nr:serine hydrolase [Candidatus Latescibacterota bacterium]
MFLIIALFVLSALAPRLAEAHNGTVAQAAPVAGIVVDGDAADWPATLPTYPIARAEYGDAPSGEQDLSAHFRVGYNHPESALYIVVEVNDESAVLDTAAGRSWDTQDGCELYLDAVHGSLITQYAYYLDQPSGRRSWDGVEVAAKKTAVGWRYEWRVELPEVGSGLSLGFDLSVADKDQDGSFSWIAWSPGTQKASVPDRCGDLLLADPTLKLGRIAGRIAWRGTSGTPSTPLPRRVRFQPLQPGSPQVQAKVDSTGAYTAALPAGAYALSAVDAMELRVVENDHLHVRVEADRQAEAGLFQVSPLPEPQLAGEQGLLLSPGPLDPAQVDRFAQAYMEYFKIPGLSLALIKDGAIVYHRGFGVKSTATGEPVSDSTLFEAASMTKPIFAYTVHRLVDCGVLDLDTPLYTYLPYPDAAHDERYKLITARMVLSHTTGFPNWRSGPKLDIEFDPGTKVGYSGEGFEYLKAVVGQLTGKDPEQVVEEEVFGPLGMDNAYLSWRPRLEPLTAFPHSGEHNIPSPKGKPEKANMAASLHVDAGTYAKFLVALIEGRGLSTERLADMLKPHSRPTEWGGDGTPPASGLGLFIDETPCGTSYGHGGRNGGGSGGYFTSKSAVYRDRKVGYVFLTNNDQATRFDKALRAFLIEGTGACGSAGVQSAGKAP